MKITAAAIIAAASLSLLTAPVSADTMSAQEWINSQYFGYPGTAVKQAPRYEFSKNAQDWTIENMNGPRKVFKNEKQASGYEFNQDPQDWILSERNGPRKVFKN